jgi:hypothetical protein
MARTPGPDREGRGHQSDEERRRQREADRRDDQTENPDGDEIPDQ